MKASPSRAATVRRLPLPRFGAGPQIVLVLLVVGLFGSMAIEPTRQLLDQRERITGMAAELDELQATNRALRARIERLNNPDYLEQRAREEIGLVRPGEESFVVMPPSRSRKRAADARPTEPETPEKSPSLIEGLVAFLGL